MYEDDWVWVSIRSTYNKHVIEEKDNSGVSLFFLVRISHIVQWSQHSKLSVKGCECLKKKETTGFNTINEVYLLTEVPTEAKSKRMS